METWSSNIWHTKVEMEIQFRCKVCILSLVDQTNMTKLISNITECVYTNEIQFNNKIDLIIVICEQHGLYIIT